MNKKGNNKLKDIKQEASYTIEMIHVLLSHIYIIFFFAVVLGVIFDAFFPSDFFSGIEYQYIGMIMIILGTIIIYWAQSSTNHRRNKMYTGRGFDFFSRGPYKYTRNPTNFGLTIMSLGLGFLINSLFSIIFILIIYILSKLIFIKKQDNILGEKYGEGYKDYLKKVKDWL